MRFPLGPGPYRDRLLDAMASLLVDLHRAGVFWGDCSLANTLFRRDGDKIQAYLVDAETSEIHPSLSDGQRAFDLDILVENVGFGLADLGAMQGRADAFEDAVEAAEIVRDPLPRAVGRAPRRAGAGSPTTGTRSGPGSAGSTISASRSTRSASSRRPGGEAVRLRVAVASRRFHARELERLTGLVALEGQARLLLNDLREYQAWLELERRQPGRARGGGRRLDARRPLAEPGDRWPRPSARPATRSRRTATCSRRSGCCPRRPARTSGSTSPCRPTWRSGPRRRRSPEPTATIALDIDWSGGFDSDRE